MSPLLTAYQELNVRTIGKFISLARIAENGEDPKYVVMRLIKLAYEYNQRDAELLNDLPSTEKGPSGTIEVDGETIPFRSEIRRK